MSVLLPVALRQVIDAEVKRQGGHSHRAALNRSEWIRRAIERDLAHARRSRKGRLSALELEGRDASRDQVEQLVGAEPMHAPGADESPAQAGGLAGVRDGQASALP